MSFKNTLRTNLATFLNLNEFAVNATFRGRAIPVIFDDATQIFSVSDGKVEMTKPTAMARSADVIGAIHNDIIRINAINYKIIGIQGNTIGDITTLLLSKD